MSKKGYTATGEGQIYLGQNIWAPGKRLITNTNPNSKPINANTFEVFRINSIIYLNRIGNIPSTFSVDYIFNNPGILWIDTETVYPTPIAFNPIQNGNLFTIPEVVAGTFSIGQFELYRQYIRENIRQIWTTSLFQQNGPNFSAIDKYVNPNTLVPEPGTNYGVSTAANILIDAYPAANDPYPDEYDYRFWFNASALGGTGTWQGNINGPADVSGNLLGLPYALKTTVDNSFNNPLSGNEKTDTLGNSVPDGLTGVRVFSIDVLRQRRYSPDFFGLDPLLAPVVLPIPVNGHEINNTITSTDRGQFNPINELYDLQGLSLQKGECIGNVTSGGGRSNVEQRTDNSVSGQEGNRRIINFVVPSRIFTANTYTLYPILAIHGQGLSNTPAHEFGHVMGLGDRYGSIAYARGARRNVETHLGDLLTDSNPINNTPMNLIQNIAPPRNTSNPSPSQLSSLLGAPNDTFTKWRTEITHMTGEHSPVSWPMYFPAFFVGDLPTLSPLLPNPVADVVRHDLAFAQYPSNYDSNLTPYDIEYSTYYGWHHNIMSTLNNPVYIIEMGGGTTPISRRPLTNNFLNPRGLAGHNESRTYEFLMNDANVNGLGGGAVIQGVGYSDIAANDNVTTIFITQVQLDIVLNLEPASGETMRLETSESNGVVTITPSTNPQHPIAEREENNIITSPCSRDAFRPNINGTWPTYAINESIGQYPSNHPKSMNKRLWGARIFWSWIKFINLDILDSPFVTDNTGAITNLNNMDRVLNDFDIRNVPTVPASLNNLKTSSFAGVFYGNGNTTGYWVVADNNYRQIKTTNVIHVGVDDVMDFRMSYPKAVTNTSTGANGFEWDIYRPSSAINSPVMSTNLNHTNPATATATIINHFHKIRAYKPFNNRYGGGHEHHDDPIRQRAEYGDSIDVLNAIARYIGYLTNLTPTDTASTFAGFIGTGSGIFQDYRFLTAAPLSQYYLWDYSKPNQQQGNKGTPYSYGYYLENDNFPPVAFPMDGITLEEAERLVNTPQPPISEEVDNIIGALSAANKYDNLTRALWNAEDFNRLNTSNSIIAARNLIVNASVRNVGSLSYGTHPFDRTLLNGNPPGFGSYGGLGASAGQLGMALSAFYDALGVLNLNTLPMFNGLLGSIPPSPEAPTATPNVPSWEYMRRLIRNVGTLGGGLNLTAPTGVSVPVEQRSGSSSTNKFGFRLWLRNTDVYPALLPNGNPHPLAGNLIYPLLTSDMVFDIILPFYRNRRFMINNL